MRGCRLIVQLYGGRYSKGGGRGDLWEFCWLDTQAGAYELYPPTALRSKNDLRPQRDAAGIVQSMYPRTS